MTSLRSVLALRFAGAVVALTLAALVCVDPAFAQLPPMDGVMTPPDAQMLRNEPVWPGYVVIFVLGVVIVAISLMPSKRAHQD